MENYVQDLLETLQLYQNQFPLEGSAEVKASSMESIRQHIEDIDLEYLEEDIPKVLKSIFDGAGRVQKIVSDLQSFSRSDEQGCKPTDIRQSIESTLNMLSSQLSDEIVIHKDYGDLPSVVCNPGEINQVLLSILVNAIDVMNQDATDSDSARSKEIFIRTWLTESQSIHIGIKNTGPSIPVAIRSKIFDPFFTTKPIGQGTGLGLAISYQTMQKHHGDIRVNTEESDGTEFIIDLPLNENYSVKGGSLTSLGADASESETSLPAADSSQKAA